MKKLLPNIVSLLILFSAGLLHSQSIPELLYYKFDGSGTSVPNYASAPPPGTATATIMGGLTQGGSNICQGTIIGSGVASSTDYVNTGWATNLTGTSWTISFRTSNIGPSATLFYIFGDASAGSFRCFTNGVAGANNWILRGGFTDVLLTGGATAAPHMNTFVYDMALGNITAYLDGVLVNTVAQAGPTIAGAGPLKVVGYVTQPGLPLNGYLDEFRVYSHALTPAEVMELYNPFATAGFLGPDQPLCPSSPIELTLQWPTSSVLWSDASTADSIIINVADTFSVSVSGTCGSGSDTIVFISTATASSITPVSCGDYNSPSGSIYSASGIYSDTIPNFAGCDSVISIDLLVNLPSSNTINPSTCAANYVAPSGAIYSMSGTYADTIPNAVGCDSLITINLTLNSPSSSNISPTVCGSYTSPSGGIYSSSSTFNDTIVNGVGCDSVITINLTVNSATSSSISPSSCGSYTSPSGSIYNSSATFNDTIPNLAGCDSVITINLTVTNVNTAVNQTGSSGENLSAAATGTYQWIDCGTMLPIASATNQTFVASANGSYAVIVTQAGCSDTSSCFIVAGLGLNQNALAELVRLFPNPTHGNFTINVGIINESLTIELINNVGQVVKSSVFKNTNVASFEIDGPSGLYFVRITNSYGEKTSLRVIKD